MSCRRRQYLQKSIEAMRQKRNRFQEEIQRKKDEEFAIHVQKNMKFQLKLEKDIRKIMEESKNGSNRKRQIEFENKRRQDEKLMQKGVKKKEKGKKKKRKDWKNGIKKKRIVCKELVKEKDKH